MPTFFVRLDETTAEIIKAAKKLEYDRMQTTDPTKRQAPEAGGRSLLESHLFFGLSNAQRQSDWLIPRLRKAGENLCTVRLNYSAEGLNELERIGTTFSVGRAQIITKAVASAASYRDGNLIASAAHELIKERAKKVEEAA